MTSKKRSKYGKYGSFKQLLSFITAGTPTACTVDGSVAGSPGRVRASWQEARAAVSTRLAFRHRVNRSHLSSPGAGIMEADDRQVTTVFTLQPSFHHRHSTNPVS